MPKHMVSFHCQVEIEAEDSVAAEAKLKSKLPSSSILQDIGTLYSTGWSIQLLLEPPPMEAPDA